MADRVFIESQKIDLGELYTRAFGHVAPPFPLLGFGDPNIVPVDTFKAIKGTFQKNSVLGTEFFMPVKIDEFQLPLEPLVMIEGGKNIVETPINRGDRVGNVLEEINLDNYKVRIRGIAISETPNEYPEDDVRRLREILERPGSRSIQSPLTTLFNINLVAIKRARIFDLAGSPESQPFVLECLSDEDFELEIITNDTL